MEKRGCIFRKRWIGLIAVMAVLLLSSTGNAEWTPVIPPDLGIDWGLQDVHFLSTAYGWAVGTDYTNKRGMALLFQNGSWESVQVPEVSSDWELHNVFFTSTGQGWATGVDHAGERGVLLQFIGGAWTVAPLPNVSPKWELFGLQFTSTESWAVGADYSNQRGVLLHYVNGLWTNVIPPDVSPSWGLYSVYFTSASGGWAVGADFTNKRGALIQLTRDINTNEKNWNVVNPPQVDSDWALNGIHFFSGDGWAVGADLADKSAFFLHWDGSTWTPVIVPEVSSNWELTGVQFSSLNNGWAVGTDYTNRTGVLIQAEDLGTDKGSWVVVNPPEVSSDWGLNGVSFISANDGWAVGSDLANQTGVLLRYSSPTAKETVSAPALPAGPTSGAPGIDYTYWVGGSASSLDHSIQYFIDWGDGTNSGWLPVNTLSASKSWASPGLYVVKAQARSATNNSVVSKLSPGLNISLSSPPVTILPRSPGDGSPLGSCSLYSLPTFAWDVTGSFSSYEIQFSKIQNFSSIAVSTTTSSTTLLMQSNTWNKVVLIPGMTGGPVFWRVVGTEANKATVTSGVFTLNIDPAQAVGNPSFVNAGKSSLPTLSWENNCNIKFTVWFGKDPSFSKRTSLALSIKDPSANGGLFTNTLKLNQWKSARAVVGNVSGSTIYWFVQSWDGANRSNKTEVMSFILN